LKQWYERYQQGSPLTCSEWEAFRDPRETTYTKYTELQMKKETFVDGILEEIEATSYDRTLSARWLQILEILVAPFRYPGNAFMMIAAYIGQMAPSGRITVAASFQAGDEARRVERLAYRIRQIQLTFPTFASSSKSLWERDACWQPLRKSVEGLLITYDWGESFVALNLVLKPSACGKPNQRFATSGTLKGVQTAATTKVAIVSNQTYRLTSRAKIGVVPSVLSTSHAAPNTE
jgi:toluene monooxygenase system protein E